MTRKQAIRQREKLAAQLSPAAGVLRGSLLQRTLHHSSCCSRCAGGEGHPLWVLTVGYPGGKNRQVSLRPDQVPQVRKALEHYRRIKQSLEAISGLNQFLLRGWIVRSPNGRGFRHDRHSPPATHFRRWLHCPKGPQAKGSKAVEDHWEPWMRHADTVLEDNALLLLIQQELAKRCIGKVATRRGRIPRLRLSALGSRPERDRRNLRARTPASAI